MPTVMITGANRGLGLEFTRQYRDAGWQVIATCRDPASAQELHGLKTGQASLQVEPLDVADFATIDALAGALATGPYILGETFSAADVIVGSGVRWMLMFKLLPERHEFTSYAERLAERPALQRALDKDKALAATLAG